VLFRDYAIVVISQSPNFFPPPALNKNGGIVTADVDPRQLTGSAGGVSRLRCHRTRIGRIGQIEWIELRKILYWSTPGCAQPFNAKMQRNRGFCGLFFVSWQVCSAKRTETSLFASSLFSLPSSLFSLGTFAPNLFSAPLPLCASALNLSSSLRSLPLCTFALNLCASALKFNLYRPRSGLHHNLKKAIV
jgi:hypothetical protein